MKPNGAQNRKNPAWVSSILYIKEETRINGLYIFEVADKNSKVLMRFINLMKRNFMQSEGILPLVQRMFISNYQI